MDAQGIPLAVELTAANVHDCTRLIPLVDSIAPIRRPRGRPRKRPHKLHADKGYDYPVSRRALRHRRIIPRIARRDQLKKRSEAMRRAAREFPDLLAKYRAAGDATMAKAAGAARMAKSDAVISFERLVDRVQMRDRCSRLAALQKAAREFPAEREAYARALS